MRLLLLLTNLSILATAQTVQDAWLAPSLLDNSTRVTNGAQFTIRWNSSALPAFFAQYAPGVDPSNAALWVIGTIEAQYKHLIDPFVDTTTQNEIPWIVDLPEAEVKEAQFWGLSFIAQNGTYMGKNYPQISSPIFIITPNTTTPGTNATSTNTGTSSTSESGHGSGDGKSKRKRALSGGAIAGIAIGAVAVLALVIGGILFFAINKRREASGGLMKSSRSESEAWSGGSTPFHGQGPPSYGGQDGTAHYAHREEEGEMVIGELQGTPRAEADSSVPSELPGNEELTVGKK